MATSPRILAFAASARRESLNRKFLSLGVEAARKAGAEVTLLDLNDFEMPIFHGDLEEAQGLPANTVRLVELITAHHALLVASPEYNNMFTPLFKNTIDWCTRADGNPFEGKVAAVMSASPGIHGGVRSLQLAQQLLLKLGCHVVPAQCILPHAESAFDAQGNPKDPHVRGSAQALVAKLLLTTARLIG